MPRAVLWQPPMWPGFSRQEEGYQTTVFVAGVAHDFQAFSQLIDYSPILFVWSKSYTPNNLSGKYFKLVETFLMVVVSQNVLSAEIDNSLQIPPLCYRGEGAGETWND